MSSFIPDTNALLMLTYAAVSGDQERPRLPGDSEDIPDRGI